MHNPHIIDNKIQIPIYKSRGNIPQLATKSALEMNFIAKPNSMNPNEIFMSFIQSPDFASEERSDGMAANTMNGSESATANPNIPTIGPMREPETTDSTSNVPIIMAVQENDTKTNVNAIKNILINPFEESAFWSK